VLTTISIMQIWKVESYEYHFRHDTERGNQMDRSNRPV
jgi:hypothetical protein